ncbi:MAG TPA: YceH family protein [Casimicrobiaceae bacterium]|nr:YceH family protein [Casimicrobiaceae bacterium]
MDLPTLSLLETRVLGVLVEKRHTVPDTYPLTLNALVAGCNQKSSRDPVLDARDADVQAAVDHLRQLSLVVESSGGRVMRYAENAARALGLPSESVALLATLMLRGPQTPAEIRQNCERLHRFSDVSSVEAFLDELASRPSGPFVAELPRQPGMREARWMHLLSGPPDPSLLTAPSAPVAAADAVAIGEVAALKRNVDDLAREVAQLKAELARVMEELGIRR